MEWSNILGIDIASSLEFKLSSKENFRGYLLLTELSIATVENEFVEISEDSIGIFDSQTFIEVHVNEFLDLGDS